MPNRAAILIHCSVEHAEQIRHRAEADHRQVSSYILNVLMPMIDFEERLYAKLTAFSDFNRTAARRSVRWTGPHKTVLLRCSGEESLRIRRAAERRDMTLSGFVMHCLNRAWSISQKINASHPPPRGSVSN